MKWLELHIDTNHSGLETVEALLSSLDIDGLVIDDEEEFQDFLENNRQYWDYVDEDLEKAMRGRSRVTFYLPADETGFAKMGEVRIALEALKAAGSTDSAAVQAALWDVQYDGVTGSIAFDDVNGDAVRDTAFIKIADTANNVWTSGGSQQVAG